MSFDQAIKDAAADISSFMPTGRDGKKMLHGTGAYEQWVEAAIRRSFERHQYVSSREQALAAQVEAAREVINRGVEIMESHQIGQWAGVRAWLEQDTESYISGGVQQ